MKLRELIKSWLSQADQHSFIASKYDKSGNQLMANTEISSASAKTMCANELEDVLDGMESATSASSNSDYAAALRVYQQYLTSDDRKLERSFCDFIEQRLHPPKASNVS